MFWRDNLKKRNVVHLLNLNDKTIGAISTVTKLELLNALNKAWSIKSSSKWSSDNPAKGQCGVTSLVVQDTLGGEIQKTQLAEGWHYYNVIDHKRYDFTESQFGESINYEDIPSNREEAFMDTNLNQYNHLKNSVEVQLSRLSK